jgi:hypothetical protein
MDNDNALVFLWSILEGGGDTEMPEGWLPPEGWQTQK